MLKIQSVVTRLKNTIRKERTYDVLSIQKIKRQWYKKYSENATSPDKQKGKINKHVWLSGRLHVEGRLNERPRLQRKHIKGNTRERRHDICKPNARKIQLRATRG